MAGDLIREVRRAVLTHLKDSEAVTDLVDAASIHPGKTPPNPAWPFTRVDGFNSTGITASCVDGATVSFLLHAFARERIGEDGPIETAEDHASIIGSALRTALHQRRLPIDDDTSARVRVQSSRVIRDGDDPDAYHAILTIEARVIAD